MRTCGASSATARSSAAWSSRSPSPSAARSTASRESSRGVFILGGAVARELDVGFVAIRKGGSLFPGPKAERRTATDYRGRETVLRLQRASLEPGDRVLLVDDWFETGAQALAATALVADCGAELVGAAVIVDELAGEARDRLGPLHALVHAGELPADSVAAPS